MQTTKRKWRNRQEQWDYAMSLLDKHGIEPTDKRMTFSGATKNGYFLIVHSKNLGNCVHIGAYDTNETIKRNIELQIKIAQARDKKQRPYNDKSVMNG